MHLINNPDYHNLAIAALITTGLRVGELLALTPEDVQLESKRLIIDKMEHSKSFQIINSCKDNSERWVYLNDDAVIVFDKLLNLRSSDVSDCAYLFLNHLQADDKLHLRAIDNRLRKIQLILGYAPAIEMRSPHDCRRTYASIQYLHGISIKTIQMQLGHASTQQTWDYVKDIVDSTTRAESLKKGCILDVI